MQDGLPTQEAQPGLHHPQVQPLLDLLSLHLLLSPTHTAGL